MNGLEIDEDKFITLPVDDQRLALFQNVVHIRKDHNKRIKKLETEKWYQRGAIGGAIAIFGFLRYLK